MNIKEKIEDLRITVGSGRFKKAKSEFGGAGLIITSNSNRNIPNENIIIVSSFALELSWLIEQLKELWAERIDHLNKYHFYPFIGGCIKAGIKRYKDDIKEIMLLCIDLSEAWWDAYSELE